MPERANEIELSVSLDEARREVADVTESIIGASLDKAMKIFMVGFDKLDAVVNNDGEILTEEFDGLPSKSRRLLTAISELRKRMKKLSEGIRPDVTNDELVKLVDELAGLNEQWKAYVGDDSLIKDAESLIAVMEHTPDALQRKFLPTNEKGEKERILLTDECLEKLRSPIKPI